MLPNWGSWQKAIRCDAMRFIVGADAMTDDDVAWPERFGRCLLGPFSESEVRDDG